MANQPNYYANAYNRLASEMDWVDLGLRSPTVSKSEHDIDQDTERRQIAYHNDPSINTNVDPRLQSQYRPAYSSPYRPVRRPTPPHVRETPGHQSSWHEDTYTNDNTFYTAHRPLQRNEIPLPLHRQNYDDEVVQGHLANHSYRNEAVLPPHPSKSYHAEIVQTQRPNKAFSEERAQTPRPNQPSRHKMVQNPHPNQSHHGEPILSSYPSQYNSGDVGTPHHSNQSANSYHSEEESDESYGTIPPAPEFISAGEVNQLAGNFKPATAISVHEESDGEGALSGVSEDDDMLFIPDQAEMEGERETASPKRPKSRGISKAKILKQNGNLRRGRPVAGPHPDAPIWMPSFAKQRVALDEMWQENRERDPNFDGDKPQLIPSIRQRKPRWETVIAPPMKDTAEVSRASRLKRGIKVDTTAKRISLHGRGAADPDNIEIVNLKDIHGLDFKEIAIIINRRRVTRGETPNQTNNSVNCRYNRVAPYLYALQGRPFVRIADRATTKGQAAHHKPTKQEQDLIWNDELDWNLVKLEREYNENKWTSISATIRERFADPENPQWPTDIDCALRFTTI